ncbi:MAG: L-2-hydroxyglutarate oxidase [Ignavibacteria bacterium]|nr:L-2-hydroxyglutarate oxidase [Ignavibacteria bacterium]
MSRVYDIAIIGGGIVGTAVALKIMETRPCKVVLLEAEDSLAAHQTGNNSGVIHSGLYYKPGSLKALNCTRGRNMLYQFCAEQGIEHEHCGKIVVATGAGEIAALDELEKKGRANGLEGLRRLSKDELHEYEPHVAGIDGLFVPQTGIVDYNQVTAAYARLAQQKGAEILTSHKVLGIRNRKPLVIQTCRGPIESRFVINCAGLQSDRVARMCGLVPEVIIVPFRGEYYTLREEKRYLVRNLIYPVPDARFPFLGVHFTRMVNGEREAGPNAVLAYKREGYSHWDISCYDMLELFVYPGFWKMASQYWQMGMQELYRSFSKEAFVRSMQRLIPEIQESDVVTGGAGVRAQALDRSGKLLDDFCIMQAENMIHVLNAPSPAATASLSIAGHIASLVPEKNN